jgi:hypothetical protein
MNQREYWVLKNIHTPNRVIEAGGVVKLVKKHHEGGLFQDDYGHRHFFPWEEVDKYLNNGVLEQLNK